MLATSSIKVMFNPAQDAHVKCYLNIVIRDLTTNCQSVYNKHLNINSMFLTQSHDKFGSPDERKSSTKAPVK